MLALCLLGKFREFFSDSFSLTNLVLANTNNEHVNSNLMKQYLDLKNNYFFPAFSRILGCIIAIIGIIGLFTKGFETFILSIVGIGLIFTRMGVLIDKENDRLKEYTQIYWLKTGKWKPLKNYPYLTVLEITERSSMFSQSNVESSSREMVFRITLLNHNHYEKILLKQFKNKEKAHIEVLRIANELNVEKTIYSPG